MRWFTDGGDPDHTLSDLVHYIKHAPDTSAFYRSYAGEEAIWGLNEQLLAAISDQMATQIWFKTKDGSKGINRPKPIPRPGVEEDVRTKGTPMSIEEMGNKLGMQIF